MTVHTSIGKILQPAYRCPEFDRACTAMRWDPAAGHVPRGVYGAIGNLSEVELVLVVAEPGDPHQGETHTGLDSAYDYAGKVLRAGQDKFHRNLKAIFDLCWPNESIEQQLRKVWLTESVLCSAKTERAPVPARSCRACVQNYLLPQLELFPHALVVACGNKARDRLVAFGLSNIMAVRAVAPPGGNTPDAYNSWEEIPVELARRANRFKA
jgi:hypothetical protein